MIFVFPGMGADNGMFSSEWRCLPKSRFLDWPRAWSAPSIRDLAVHMAQSASISDGDTLIGTSLGGIVACEIAAILKIERIVLVGSAKKKEEISTLLRVLRPLVGLAPLGFARQACGKLPSELGAMFERSDPVFIRAMCRAIFQWEGFKPDFTALHRIHGARDFVIPPPHDGELLVDGGHLIAMTHAERCVRLVEKVLQLPPLS